MQYNGGKARIGRELASVISSFKPSVYWEPFVGAGHVIQHVESPVRFGSDLDTHTQENWIPPDLLITDEIYQAWRISQPRTREEFAIRAMIGYGCSFAGKWFGGLARDKRKDTSNSFYQTAQIATKKQSPLISNVHFFQQEFNASIPIGTDLIYCDPPYKGTTLVGSKKEFDSEFFWLWMRGWASAGITVLVTEFTAPHFAKEIWAKSRNAHLLKNEEFYLTERLFMVQP